MRKEAEADKARRERAFERLQDLKPAPRQRGAHRSPWHLALPGRGRAGPGRRTGRKRARRRQFVVAEETFDRWLFGSTGDADSGRAYLESLLQRKVEDVNQVRELSLAQRKKLVLAGRGDIKRLFDRIEDERKEFRRIRTEAERCGEFLRELQPLR